MPLFYGIFNSNIIELQLQLAIISILKLPMMSSITLKIKTHG